MWDSTPPYVLQIFSCSKFTPHPLRTTSVRASTTVSSVSVSPSTRFSIYLLIELNSSSDCTCHVTRMNCNCWCTLCIFESHFPSFWECFLSRHGPKTSLWNRVSVVARVEPQRHSLLASAHGGSQFHSAPHFHWAPISSCSAARRWPPRVFHFALAERIPLRSSSLSVCHKEGIWLHKTSLPKTCMLSCLPESCCSACLILVVSSSLCAELITAYHVL